MFFCLVTRSKFVITPDIESPKSSRRNRPKFFCTGHFFKVYGQENPNSQVGHPHLSHHAVPLPIDVLPVPPVGHQVKVVGETHNLCQPLEDIDAETFAAVLHGSAALHHQAEEEM